MKFLVPKSNNVNTVHQNQLFITSIIELNACEPNRDSRAATEHILNNLTVQINDFLNCFSVLPLRFKTIICNWSRLIVQICSVPGADFSKTKVNSIETLSGIFFFEKVHYFVRVQTTYFHYHKLASVSQNPMVKSKIY